MGSPGKRAGVAGWLGIVAVLGNILASMLSMATPLAAAQGVIDDAAGPVVLCTEHGPQVLPGTDPTGGPDQRDGQGNGKSGHCTACTLLAAPALAVALSFAPVVFAARVHHPFRTAARTLADHLGLGGIRSRAPPLSA